MNRRSKVFSRFAVIAAAVCVLAGSISLSVYALHLQWLREGGKAYWYEHDVRQGTKGDPKNIIDAKYGGERGREIYDPNSNGWYWLDAVYNGAKAENKEVWIPYIYQQERDFNNGSKLLWTDEQIVANARASGDMAGQVESAIRNNKGKWVRYNSSGAMVKEWYTVTGDQVFIYPAQAGNIYYYDKKTGLMAKGSTVIGGKSYHFNESTGVRDGLADSITVSSSLPSNVINALDYGAVPGDDNEDSESINAALNAAYYSEGIDTVYVPAGRYLIRTLPGIAFFGISNVNLVMDPNAVLEVMATDQSNYHVITLYDASNINIVGGRIEGERDKHKGTTGEWGHGIGIFGSSNVTVSYCDIRANWGDGIAIDALDPEDPSSKGCNNIKLRHCYIDDNCRTGVSLVKGDNITIDSCTINITNRAGKKAPQAGINIEPDGDDKPVAILKNIRILNTKITSPIRGDYWGHGMCFRTQDYGNNTGIITADGVTISGCVFNGDCGNYSARNMIVENTTVSGTFYMRQNMSTNISGNCNIAIRYPFNYWTPDLFGLVPSEDTEAVPEMETAPEPEVMPEPEAQSEFTPEPEAIPEPEYIPEPETAPEPEYIPEPETTPEPEAVPEPEVLSDPETVPVPEVVPEPEVLPDPVPVDEIPPAEDTPPAEGEWQGGE